MKCEYLTVRVLPNGRISAKDAAAMLGRTPKTLANWRCVNRGPRGISVGHRIYYDFDEISAFREFDEPPVRGLAATHDVRGV